MYLWPMKIGFYGKLRDSLGDESGVARAAGETVAGLRARLAGLCPGAARDLLGPRVRACVADRIVGEDFPLASQVTRLRHLFA